MVVYFYGTTNYRFSSVLVLILNATVTTYRYDSQITEDFVPMVTKLFIFNLSISTQFIYKAQHLRLLVVPKTFKKTLKKT